MLGMQDVDLRDKRVLIRDDLNVPMDGDRIRDDTRIQAALPTIRLALEQGARVILMSHLGRPEEGKSDPAFSLRPVAVALSDALGQTVDLIDDLHPVDVAPGQCVLYENVRFLSGEKNNDTQLAKRMAALCDVFVMDAFATAHRAQASTVGVAQFAPQVCAGLLFEREWQTLSQAIESPDRPILAIVGGSKVSGKIAVLEHLIQKVDALIVGGGIANTFLAAQGFAVGASLYEPDWCDRARDLLQLAEDHSVDLPLPVDVAVSTTPGEHTQASICAVESVASDEAIYDIGPRTMQIYAELVQSMHSIVWNGPLGVFEWPNFALGTEALAQAVVKSSAHSMAGGGDTVAALVQFGLSDQIGYISTAGGAFLQLLEGKSLPAVTILQQRADHHAVD